MLVALTANVDTALSAAPALTVIEVALPTWFAATALVPKYAATDDTPGVVWLKVAVATPLALVVHGPADRLPVPLATAKKTLSPETALLLPSLTVIVSVEV
jgi:hypothetical protein